MTADHNNEQCCLAVYPASGPEAAAKGVLYEVVRFDEGSTKPCKYLTYKKYFGDDDGFFELENHEDPYAG